MGKANREVLYNSLSQDSVADIAIGYRLGGLRWRRNFVFSTSVQTGPGDYPTSCTKGDVALPRG